MTNNMPETQAIQNKLTDAKHRGDLYDQARYSMELQKLMKDPEKGVSPLASIAPLMVQMPFFIGMFMGLRGMANLPVERYLYFNFPYSIYRVRRKYSNDFRSLYRASGWPHKNFVLCLKKYFNLIFLWL